NTGTGKTAAFLVPLLHRAISDPKMKVLILAPTRELAVQIQDEFNALAKELRIWSILVVGGLSMHRQIAGLRGNTRFLIATPGRLNDLKDRKAVNLATYTHLVLDEADRMVDMGFINDIRKILSGLPEQRHSLFFSATLPNEVKSLIHSFLKDPVTVSVKKQDTSANVDQDVIRVRFGESKMDILVDLLKKDPSLSKVLIFGRTKRGVDRIAMALEARDFSVVSIHGDKVQNKRQKALDLFKQNKAQILVATDVAARGLDIPNVSHVINFDVPQSYEDYVHRIGRTGRADKQGKALTFLE
ncbi:MAG: DEAD/DEAH box helicase, partial [Patescibacteria group bacterium]